MGDGFFYLIIAKVWEHPKLYIYVLVNKEVQLMKSTF